MSAQKGNILVPILGAIALLAISTAGYCFLQSQKLQNQPLTQISSQTPIQVVTPTPTTQNKITSWKTFTNSSLPFQFEYPSVWHVIDDHPRIYFSQKNITADEARGTPPGPEFPLEIFATDNKWHLDYFNNYTRELKNPPNINGKQFAQVEKITLNGKTAYKTTQFAEADMASPAFTTTINFIQDNQIVSIVYPNEHNTPSNDPSIYNQILSTFKFTN